MAQLLIVLLLMLFNAFFAMSEMAVLTSRKIKLKQMAESSRRARKALHLAEHPESFLSAVQLWITLLSLLTGYFGGESMGERIAEPLAHVDWLAPYADQIGFVSGFLLMLFLFGLIGELVPKRIGTLHPEPIAAAVAYPMDFFAKLAKPFVLALSFCTRAILRLIGLRPPDASQVSEEEIRLLVSESHEQGVIDDDERNMMNRVLRLGDRTAESLMTPRIRVTWLDAEAPVEENLQVMRETPYSRYPVYRGSDQEVLGVLEAKALAGRIGKEIPDLFAVMKPPLFVSESTRAMSLLEIFRDEVQTLALVVDEYGDIQGLVTVNDLLSAVIGRLQHAREHSAEAQVVDRPDGSYLLDGGVSTEDLQELLNLSSTPEDEEHDYNTVAGLVIAHFGRIPNTGEWLDWAGWRFEVVDLDGARIDKLLVSPIPDADPDTRGSTDPSA
ncbi:MAG: HlyC/CorC family transporter [Rhodanobacteraceae bacterium]|nr:HlyC/CorC family transporter [Xanthomonadales bacterium]MCP5477795.1 HlyC/CorC family transporter [Rhodanobacteraceae bacterium]HPF73054.1 hemolysin family protein [Xanthomonadaceae bacterium]HRX99605.1 hemolysin family protein [Xanthomonadaceae bacterium]